MTQPITTEELRGLLHKIALYQRLVDHKNGSNWGGSRGNRQQGFMDKPDSYEDISVAVKIGSPLAALFTAFILLEKNPEALAQEHLDVMHPQLHALRRQAFWLLYVQGGERTAKRLHGAGLLTDITDSFQLGDMLYNLSVTPLEDVKRMLKKRGAAESKTAVPPKPDGGGGGDDAMEYREPSLPRIGSTAKWDEAKERAERERREKSGKDADRQQQIQRAEAERLELFSRMWRDEMLREKLVSRQQTLIDAMLARQKEQEIERAHAQRVLSQQKERDEARGRGRDREPDMGR